MHDAIKTCFAQEARVCTHGDMQELCGSGMNPFEGHSAGWFGDHGSVHGGDWDDEYGTWNRNWCDKNNDGATAHANNVKPFRCCRSGALSAGRTAVCPNQLTAMSTQNGEICASGFQSQTNIHTAFDRCRGMKGHVCLHNDMQQLCGGGNPFQGSSRGWFGDHGTASGGNWDDEFGTWDNEVCNGDNDGKAYHSHHSYKYRCCAASTAVQEHGTTVTKECDAGFTRYGGLCWMNPNVRKNAHDAIEHCRGLKAHMCEHVEMQTVCAHGKNPYGDSQGWYGDHGKRGSSWDDHYGSWNHGNCAGNNDGPAYSSGHSFTFRCCKRAFIPIPHVQPNPQTQVDTSVALTSSKWETHGSVSLGVETTISGGWIKSRDVFTRPVRVSAEMRSAAHAECITMSLFASNNGKNSPYSFETGGWSNRIRLFPGDYRETVGVNNNAWDLVEIDAAADGKVYYYLNGALKYTANDNSKSSGHVRFIPGCVSMKVRNIKVTEG